MVAYKYVSWHSGIGRWVARPKVQSIRLRRSDVTHYRKNKSMWCNVKQMSVYIRSLLAWAVPTPGCYGIIGSVDRQAVRLAVGRSQVCSTVAGDDAEDRAQEGGQDGKQGACVKTGDRVCRCRILSARRSLVMNASAEELSKYKYVVWHSQLVAWVVKTPGFPMTSVDSSRQRFTTQRDHGISGICCLPR